MSPRSGVIGVCLLGALVGVALAGDAGVGDVEGRVSGPNGPLSGAVVAVLGSQQTVKTAGDGTYHLVGVPAGRQRLKASADGYLPRTAAVRVKPGATVKLDLRLRPRPTASEDEVVAQAPPAAPSVLVAGGAASGVGRGASVGLGGGPPARPAKKAVRRRPRPRPHLVRRARMASRAAMPIAAAPPTEPPSVDREGYESIAEGAFKLARTVPLSTFSIDVDSASYANVRNLIKLGRRPPKDAIRVEEFINYFHYDYPNPKGPDPFSVTTEVSQAPWNPAHRLVHVGLQGRKIDTAALPASNLVFLLDVSGSMNRPYKLPLLKSAFKLLVNNLRAHDRVAIVVYAGAAGLVLPSTSGKRRAEILGAIDRLRAGGSTAGGAGIKLAYQVARDNFIEGGNNRIILATDGDFNVGASSDAELERMIEMQRKSGVFLTILGFGRGNYQDAKMEKLSNKGNGNAAYIDSVMEAKKVLVTEMGGTLVTIAKDVKVQVEFNPARVKGYRLIGYENRALAAEDFNDDKKDAGELGAGHTVTVLYEIIPAGSDEAVPGVDTLKYQQTQLTEEAEESPELLTVKLRYKAPDGDTSKLISRALVDAGEDLESSSANFRWAAAVASFGMVLRDSEWKGAADYDLVGRLAEGSVGEDREGYRAEFLQLVQKAARL